jgi:multidrug resistance efflux pump
MPSQEVDMDVSFEQDDLCLSRNLTLPASVKVFLPSGDPGEYTVTRWSLAGFIASIYPEDGLEPDQEVDVEYAVPFPTHTASFKTRAQVQEVSGEEAHFAFTGLSNAARKLLRDYVDACITGIEPRTANYELVPGLAPAQVQKQNGRMFRRLMVYGVVVVVLALVGWFLWREFSYVYSLRGSVTGDLIQFRSVEPGFIKKVHVKNGQAVNVGDVLYELEDKGFVSRRDQLQAVLARARTELVTTQRALKNELANIKLYTQLAESKLKLLQEQLEATQAHLRMARSRFLRAEQLVESHSISRDDYDVIRGTYEGLLPQVRQKEAEIEFQHVAIAEAREGRFVPGGVLSSSNIKGSLFDIKERIAAKRYQIERVKFQIVEIATHIDHCKIRSTVAGRITHLNRAEGDSIREGEYLCTVEKAEKTHFIVARFATDDVQYLHHGSLCSVVFVNHGCVARGRIVVVGHAGLSQAGVVSIDTETAVNEVPVKIELLDLPAQAHTGEGVFIKCRRFWSITGFLQKLI